MQVASRVYLVGGPEVTEARDAAVYLIDGIGAYAVIDAGCGDSAARIVRNIRAVKPQGKAEYLVVTHAHIDHIGGLAALRKEIGGTVVAHSKDRAALETMDSARTAADLYRTTYEPCAVELAVEREEECLVVGDLTLQLLHIPGHTPGSLCAWFDFGDERVLFAQDLHGPLHPAWGSCEVEWRRSLQRMLELNADVLCEGHFGVYRGRERVASYIKHYLFA